MSITLTTVERIEEVAADPAVIPNSGFVYTKDVAGVTQLFYETDMGTVYQLTPVAAPGDTPWSRAGATVSLDQTGDTEVIPFDNATGDDTTSLGSSTRRWLNVIAGSNGLTTYDATPTITSRYTNSSASWGPGGVGGVLDSAFSRSGVAEITVSNPDAGTSARLLPAGDGDAAALIGQPANRWRAVTANNHDVSSGGAVPSARLTLSSLKLGDGAAALDVSLARTANGLFVDNDGGVGISVIPPDASGNVGIVTALLSNRWAGMAANSFNTYQAGVNANPAAQLTVVPAGGSLQMGDGIVAPDVQIEWTSAGTIALRNNLAGASMVPFASGQGALGVNGVGGRIFASMAATSVAAYAGGTDTEPKVRIASAAAGGVVNMGAGVAAGPDIQIARIAPIGANPNIVVDNGAAAAVDIIPGADNVGRIGTRGFIGSRRWAEVNAFSITSGDMCFTDEACAVCGRPFEEGDDLVLRVIKVHHEVDGRLTRTVPAHHGCR